MQCFMTFPHFSSNEGLPAMCTCERSVVPVVTNVSSHVACGRGCISAYPTGEGSSHGPLLSQLNLYLYTCLAAPPASDQVCLYPAPAHLDVFHNTHPHPTTLLGHRALDDSHAKTDTREQ